MKKRVGNCSECGRSAARNTPCIDPDGNLLCERCSYQSEVMVRGIDQFLDEHGNYIIKRKIMNFVKKESVIWRENEVNTSAWTSKGTRTYRINEEERTLQPEELLDKMIKMVENGILRCSNKECMVELPKEQMNFPLFAGVACPHCWKKHLSKLEQNRKEGKVCSMCRQPYGACCC